MSREAEVGLIGHALVLGGHTDLPLAKVHFVDAKLGELWDEIRDEPNPNPLALGKKYGEKFIGKLISSEGHYASIRQMCDDILFDYERRQFLGVLANTRKMVEQGMRPSQAIESLTKFEVQRDETSGPRQLSDLMREAYGEIESVSTGQKESRLYLPTGYAAYDDEFFGFERGAYTIVCGRPSQGKTAWATGAAIKMAKRGLNVLIMSLEMSSLSITYRVLSMEARLDLQLLRRGMVKSQEAWRKLADATTSIADASLWIDDEPNVTETSLRAKIRSFHRKHGLDVCIVDYVGLVGSDDRSKERHRQIGELSQVLKHLSVELDIAMVALCQLGRDVEKRHDKRPIPSDLRDSGSLEQDADVIIGLYRDEYYNRTPENRGLAEVLVLKNRNGPVGKVTMLFDAEFARFKSPDAPGYMGGFDA